MFFTLNTMTLLYNYLQVCSEVSDVSALPRFDGNVQEREERHEEAPSPQRTSICRTLLQHLWTSPVMTALFKQGNSESYLINALNG